MTDRLFIDTLFIIALANRRDQYHRQALDLADQYDEWPLLTTDAVLLEVGNALALNHKQEAIAIIERLLAAAEIQIVRMTPDLFARAFAIYKRHQDKSWGLVDCIRDFESVQRAFAIFAPSLEFPNCRMSAR